VVAIYFAAPQRYRRIILLAASYYFYMSWEPEYVILILISTLSTYLLAILMGKTIPGRKRKACLVIAICINLGLLLGFKYFNFLNEETRAMFQQFGLFYGIPDLKILLPIGISFYTLQATGYLIDVYTGRKEPETHLDVFALFIAFFPQLIAGPIERSYRFLPQLKKKTFADPQRFSDGLRLMLWGFFKKVVIADNLGLYVDMVYNNVHDYSGSPLILATYFFTFQIYCDFSGYTDIARGAARILGFDLMINFRMPYFSKSVDEFWRNWHISLSTWFRDYLYIPLGGNRVSLGRWQVNILIVFLVSGLWHGANWTFAAWGAIHGLFMICSRLAREIRGAVFRSAAVPGPRPAGNALKAFLTFNLVAFAWILFRANSLGDAAYIATHMFRGIEFSRDILLGFGNVKFLVSVFSIFVLLAVDLLHGVWGVKTLLSGIPAWLRWALYYTCILWILVFGEFGDVVFIYFQF